MTDQLNYFILLDYRNTKQAVSQEKDSNPAPRVLRSRK